MRLRFFLLLLVLLSVVFIVGSKSKYDSLSDHDRVVTALSFYEAGLRYNELNKHELGKYHIEEAKKILPDVEEYHNGKKQIPTKKININLDGIFSNES